MTSLAERSQELFEKFRRDFFASCPDTANLLLSDDELKTLFDERCKKSLERQRETAKALLEKMFVDVERRVERKCTDTLVPTANSLVAAVTEALAPDVKTAIDQHVLDATNRAHKSMQGVAKKTADEAVGQWEGGVRGDTKKAADAAIAAAHRDIVALTTKLVREKVDPELSVIAQKHAATAAEGAREKLAAAVEDFFKNRLATALEFFSSDKMLPPKETCLHKGSYMSYHRHPRGVLVQSSDSRIELHTPAGCEKVFEVFEDKSNRWNNYAESFTRWLPAVDGVYLYLQRNDRWVFCTGESFQTVVMPRNEYNNEYNNDRGKYRLELVAAHPSGYCFTCHSYNGRDEVVYETGVATREGRVLGMRKLKDGEQWFVHPRGILCSSGGQYILDPFNSNRELPVDPGAVRRYVNWLDPTDGSLVERGDGIYLVPNAR